MQYSSFRQNVSWH